MRARFHYEIEASGSCSRCGAMIPFGPLRTFRHDRRNVATRCPACGELEVTGLDVAEGMLSGWARVGTLLQRGRAGDEVERFEDAVQLQKSWPHRRAHRGRVGGPERCVHCDAPIVVAPELAYGTSAAVPCEGCGAVTHLAPPPRWLVERSPTWTHLLLPAAPPTVRCGGCGATILVGPRFAPEIQCDGCGGPVAVPTPLEAAPELDRPRLAARLALTSGAVAAKAPSAATPVVVGLVTLALAAGGAWLAAQAAQEGLGAAATMAFVSSVPVLLGVLWVVLSARSRARWRALADELRGLEAQATPPGAEAEQGPYR